MNRAICYFEATIYPLSPGRCVVSHGKGIYHQDVYVINKSLEVPVIVEYNVVKQG